MAWAWRLDLSAPPGALLPQPGDFEGFREVVVGDAVHECSVVQRVDVVGEQGEQVEFGPAEPAPTHDTTLHDDAVTARVDDLVWLKSQVFERLTHLDRPSTVGVVTDVHTRPRKCRQVMKLEVCCAELEPAIDVAAIKPLVS